MKRSSVSLSPKTVEQLRKIQAELEIEIGFEPSLAQIVEHLADKMTKGQDVVTNQSTGETK
jgi:hypothetical protein